MERESTEGKREKRKFSWRTDHRDRAHESAHAEAEKTEEPVAVHGTALVPKGPATIVTEDNQLLKLAAELRADGSFAYDSEFIGELTYFPKLCVIQVASRARVALIDPLADIDLNPFWELLADPTVEKIVHAGEQDLEPVHRHIGKPPANVFDTQVAAGFTALPYPLSLSKLVMEMTGAKLGKGLTFSHWDQRPLSPIQLRYAADDVRYLPAVRAAIGGRLTKLNHTDWAAHECAELCESSLSRFDPKTQYLRIRGAQSLAPRNLSILRELTAWRDASARQHDVPPRTFLRDEVMLDLARAPVKTMEKLSKVRGLPRPVENEYGQFMLELMDRAYTLPPEALPASAQELELSPSERFIADALFTTAQCICAGISIDPGLVVSRHEFIEFYHHATGSAPESTAVPRLLQGWRKQALGDPLLEFLKGQSTAVLQCHQGAPQVTWNLPKPGDEAGVERPKSF